MNRDEVKGGARYMGGKVEKNVGDLVSSRKLVVDGVADQVAGAAQHTYGRARSVVEDVIDGAPAVIDEAAERLQKTGKRVANSAREGSQKLKEKAGEGPLLIAVIAGLVGYGIGALIHRRDR